MNEVINTLKSVQVPVQLSGNNLIALAIIGALEMVVVTAITEGYGVNLSVETTKNGVKGSINLKASG
ncbi:hypothetical protein [Butyrivibrio sp. VCB2006]|uniref:hypothetical protein n=1 Tax=Butyrivibrio sp. VCB2006 TaxID=1280679 RepID=UPI0003FF0937|nr:hypothetical protein [Butyrivibrio sp. VCB2006]